MQLGSVVSQTDGGLAMHRHKIKQTSLTSNLLDRLKVQTAVLLTIIAIVVGFGPCGAKPSIAETKNLLVLQSYHYGNGVADDIQAGIFEGIRSANQKIEVFVEFLDVVRHPYKLNKATVEYVLRERYKDTKIDLIIVSDDEAYEFMLEYHATLFPGIPVVFCGVNEFDENDLPAGIDITGTLEIIDIEDTLKIARRLHPDAQRIHIYDAGPDSRGTTTGVIAQTLKSLVDDIPVTMYEALSFEEILKVASQTPENTIIFPLTFAFDKDGAFRSWGTVTRAVGAETDQPIYVFFDPLVGIPGVVGGRVLSSLLQGRIAAKMAADILNGTDIASIPVQRRSLNEYRFDYKDLQKQGIDPNLLPPNSTILNIPPSIIEKHPRIFWGAIALLAFLILVVFGLIIYSAQKRRAETVLRESARSLELFINAVPQALGFVDDEGRYTLVNHAAASLLNLNTDQVNGRAVSEILPPYVYDQVRPHIESCLNGNTVSFSFRDSEDRAFEAVYTPRLNESGKVGGYYFAAADVTDRIAAEDQLRQAQKMEAVGQLTGGVAHDFNNILAVISGNLEIAEMQRENAAPIQRILNRISHAVERGSSLTSQLLVFARRQPLQSRQTQLNFVVNDMLALLRRSLGEHIEIEIDTTEELWECVVDASQLQNAFLNLALNARDAMQNGGKLLIKTANISALDIVPENKQGQSVQAYVMLSVTDTGTGIEPEILDSIFDPFFTTKEVGHGTGLGLSMVFGFVKQSNGFVKVESEIGKGTTFKIYLPRVIHNHAAEQIPKAVKTVIRGHGERILVVEDNDAVREFVIELVRDLGYSVSEARSSVHALEMVKQQRNFALLLADIVLPGGMNGYELANLCQDIQPDIKVVYMSGYANDDLGQFPLELDNPILQKPFKRTDLAFMIDMVLNAADRDSGKQREQYT